MTIERRTYGKRYDEKLDTKKIAEILRREVRLESKLGLLPKGQWSVTMDRYSGGSSITIAFAPLPEEDELFARAYYSRDRIVVETEHPSEYTALPFRSEFGTALYRRLESKLGDFNHEGGDAMVDHFDTKFHGSVSIRSRTDSAALGELYKTGKLPVEPLHLPWAAMAKVWEKEALGEAIVTAELRTAAVAELRADQRLAMALDPTDDPHVAVMLTTGRVERVGIERHKAPVLRLVPSPETSARRVFATITDESFSREEIRTKLEMLRGVAKVWTTPRPGEPGYAPPRARRPIAVPVGAVPQATNPAWARLALAEELNLDWAIPGLVLP